MPSPTRLIVRGAPLPPTFKGTLNQFYQAMLDRLEVLSPFGQLQFQVGGVQPTSNVGPWLKDGTEWYVWDESTKTYVPITINPASITAILASYYTKTEIDTNFYTAAETDVAIAAAIGGIVIPSAVAGQNLFKAKPSGNQDIVHGGAGIIQVDVALGTTIFDPDSDFGSSIFTAPANGYYEFRAAIQVFLAAGAPSRLISYGSFSTSGGQLNPLSNDDDTVTGQRFHTGSTVFQLTAGDTVKLVLTSDVDAAATVRIGEAYTFFTGNRIR